MNLEQFLNLTATIFGAIGSVYVLRSILQMTPKMTERLSATMWGYNPEIIDSLSKQKAESVVGTALILIALLIAIINSATTPSIIVINSSRMLSITIIIVISALVYGFLLLMGLKVNQHHRRMTARIIVARKLERLSSMEIIPFYELQSLYAINEKFLDVKVPTGSSNREFLLLLAKDMSMVLPEGIQVEEDTTE